MKKQLIFFHGGDGQGDYNADAKMVESLKSNLGPEYSVHYPLLSKEEVPDFGRRKQIASEIASREDNVFLMGHSLGASMLLAYLSENKIDKKIAGIFLLATPFWQGEEDWVKPLKLHPDFATKLDQKVPLFFYHCSDDEEVPVDHLHTYKNEISWAVFRVLPKGGHQLGNDLSVVAKDVQNEISSFKSQISINRAL